MSRADSTHTARLTAQLLSGEKASSPEQVVGRLLAVQAQDPRGFRLTVRSRSEGVLASDVDAAMTERRSLVLTWLNRGTLHLVESSDYWWLKPLTTPQLATANATRLGQEGVSPAQADMGIELIASEVGAHGPRTRDEVRDALDRAGIPTAGQATYHLLFAASLHGDLVRGPMRGNEHCYVSATTWLGAAPAAIERADALAMLARRYLAGHGPADPRDLAKWAGIGLRDAREAFGAIADEVAETSDGLIDLIDREPAAPLPAPRLLGAFDPILHGWASRSDFVGPHLSIVTTNGLFRPFAIAGGVAVATWGLRDGRVTVTPLETITKAVERALEKDADDVLRYLGLAR